MNQSNLQNSLKKYLPVLKYGDPRLRKKVQTVDDFSIIPEMIETMYETMAIERGIGLAANQVGFNVNLIIIDTCNDDEDDGESYIFINAKIIHSDGESIMEEGCLSIPEIRAQIKRPKNIVLQYQDLEQTTHERHFSDLTSRVIQHEMDHLNGKLFIDYLSQTKRILINKRLLEITKTGNPSSGIIL